MEYVNAQKEIKRAKKKRGKEGTTAAPTEQQTQDMPDAEAPGDNEEGSETDHPHSFSCLNQINKRIKLDTLVMLTQLSRPMLWVLTNRIPSKLRRCALYRIMPSWLVAFGLCADVPVGRRTASLLVRCS